MGCQFGCCEVCWFSRRTKESPCEFEESVIPSTNVGSEEASEGADEGNDGSGRWIQLDLLTKQGNK